MVVKDHSGWGSKKYINFGLDAEAPVVSTILWEEGSGTGALGDVWSNDSQPYITTSATDEQAQFNDKWSARMYTPAEVVLGTDNTNPDTGLELDGNAFVLNVSSSLELANDENNESVYETTTT